MALRLKCAVLEFTWTTSSITLGNMLAFVVVQLHLPLSQCCSGETHKGSPYAYQTVYVSKYIYARMHAHTHTFPFTLPMPLLLMFLLFCSGRWWISAIPSINSQYNQCVHFFFPSKSLTFSLQPGMNTTGYIKNLCLCYWAIKKQIW